jgi:hypothetical protein
MVLIILRTKKVQTYFCGHFQPPSLDFLMARGEIKKLFNQTLKVSTKPEKLLLSDHVN